MRLQLFVTSYLLNYFLSLGHNNEIQRKIFVVRSDDDGWLRVKGNHSRLLSRSTWRISSIFPLGLFYAWKWQRPAGELVVFPRPVGGAPGPRIRVDLASISILPGRQSSDELMEFQGHRPFQMGDSLASIDWKARSRGRPLLVKEYEGSSESAAMVTWDAAKITVLANASTQGDEKINGEAILSQLAAWVLEFGATESFMLVLPHVSVGPGFGNRHLARCLRTLAAVDHEL